MHQTEAEGQKPVSGIMQLVKMQKGILSGKRHNAKRHLAKRHNANRHDAPINVKPVGGGRQDFDRSLWPRGRAFELPCCPGDRDI